MGRHRYDSMCLLYPLLDWASYKVLQVNTDTLLQPARRTIKSTATGGLEATQILIFWRTNKNTVVVQLAIISERIRVNYHTLAVIIPVV